MDNTFKSKRISAISTIIKDIDLNKPTPAKPVMEFQFVVADNLFHRLNAFRLGYAEYLKKGYIDENQYQVLMNNFDLSDDTLTIVAYHGNKEVGTLTVNTQKVLPFQEIFSCDIVKDKNFKGAELTRLAIDEDYRNQKDILLGMFNLAFIHAKFIKNCSHLAIEVNPRHVKFYQRFLGFEPVAENANCPRVRGAPAVLLLGNLELPFVYPDNYPFLAVGGEREYLINQLKNIKLLSINEIKVLARMYRTINQLSSQESGQYASV